MHGQSSDLKRNAAQRFDLEALEEYFRKNVFEATVAAVMEKGGFQVIRQLKDYHQGTTDVLLPCGEIDCLGISVKSNAMLLVEAKCFAPVIDTRMMASDLRDLY